MSRVRLTNFATVALYGAFSAAEVHHNPLTKAYLCQTICYDWRLQAACAGYLPYAGGC